MDASPPLNAKPLALSGAEALDLGELTPRQRQILELLRVGKVNKEIANELGIGLGTVKQHVVALFRKLRVRNRTMAVSRGSQALGGRAGEAVAQLGGCALLERRPCIVLSIQLPESCGVAAGRHLHGALTRLAFDMQAVFLARKGYAGDMIFGIEPASENDMAKAFDAARSLHQELSAFDPQAAATLRGGINAGLAVASMERHGGWSGEAIASAAIAAARDLAAAASPGCLSVGAAAHDLLRALRYRSPQPADGGPLTFAGLASLRRDATMGAAAELVGRDAELARIDSLLRRAAKGRGYRVFVEGETGMGKTRLAQAFGERCQAAGGTSVHLSCFETGTGSDLAEATSDRRWPMDEVERLLATPAAAQPQLVTIDDCHMLPAHHLQRLLAATEHGLAGRIAVFCGRRRAETSGLDGERMKLGRLELASIHRLADPLLPDVRGQARAGALQTVARNAAGVPLFAVELARSYGSAAVPLALLFIVACRLDQLGLDRKLLRCLAHAAAPMAEAAVATGLGEPIEAIRPAMEHAIAGGVLVRDEDGKLVFSHPLLLQVASQIAFG